MLFGRSAELRAGQTLIEQAAASRGGVLVLSGEPGIGKSALARALGDAAEAAGGRVAFGRAWEVGGAPAYWPWTQALLDVGIELEPLLGSASGEMAAAQRLVAFDRVVRAVFALSAERFLFIVLDDLHAADSASLELALAFARGVARQKVALVVTTRESELRQDSTQAELVAKLAREGKRLALRRLGEKEIGEWLASASFEGDASDVLRLTEGNPLFVEEAVRLGVDRFADLAAGGVPMLLREHMERASEATRAVLGAAAVFGREAKCPDVAALLALDLDRVAAAVREGVAVGVLAPARPETLEFAHILLRDAFYWSLAPSRRAELHLRAARLLGARETDAALAASHWLAAGDAAPVYDAVRGVVKAAEAALARHATEAAVVLLDGARTALGARLDEDAALVLDHAMAEALMRSGALDDARALAVSCAERAKRLARPELQAAAALTYGAEMVTGQVDPTMVRLLEEALEVVSPALPAERSDAGVRAPEPKGEGRRLNGALRARVLARLAAAMVPPKSEGDMERARAHADEALELGRAEGDPKTLFYVLRFTAATIGYSVDIATRKAMAEELHRLALAHHDDLVLANVGGFRAACLFEVGRPAEARAALDEYCRFIEGLPLPQVQWRAVAARASLAALDANYEEARALGEELHRLGLEPGGKSSLLAWGLLQIAVTICDGNIERFRAIEAELCGLLAGPTFAPWLACVHALVGRREQAIESLRPVIAMSKGFPWLVTAGQVVVLIEDAPLAEMFYPLLQSHELNGRLFWGPGGSYPIGPTSRILGELALLKGDVVAARTHFDEALEHCRQMGTAALLAATERAIARLPSVGAARPPSKEARKGVTIALVREGDMWVVSTNAFAPLRIKHGKGVEYLRLLIETPGQEHHVLVLAGAGEAPEDAGAVLDQRAKAEYRGRVEDLEDQIAEGERHGDAGRVERARRELDAIAGELASALRLGGRDHKAASNVERARINVQRRIKDTISRIAEHAPELGRYLEVTVRTGTYCSYEPI
jgi:hypothetical protein